MVLLHTETLWGTCTTTPDFPMRWNAKRSVIAWITIIGAEGLGCFNCALGKAGIFRSRTTIFHFRYRIGQAAEIIDIEALEKTW